MKVRELMEKLKMMPPEAEVVVYNQESVREVRASGDGDWVWLTKEDLYKDDLLY